MYRQNVWYCMWYPINLRKLVSPIPTRLKNTSKKPAKTMKKIFLKKFISDLPTLIFSRYETGTTGIFFMPYSDYHDILTI